MRQTAAPRTDGAAVLTAPTALSAEPSDGRAPGANLPRQATPVPAGT